MHWQYTKRVEKKISETFFLINVKLFERRSNAGKKKKRKKRREEKETEKERGKKIINGTLKGAKINDFSAETNITTKRGRGGIVLVAISRCG